MLSTRQKRSLRAFAAALSCCVLLSGLLIYAALSSGVEAEPVVFAEILDGARITADDLPDHFVGNIVTVGSAALTETMFSEELRTYTRPVTAADDDEAQGAGGTLLLNTTPLSSEAPETSLPPPQTSSPEMTDNAAETTTTAPRSTSYASKRPTDSPQPAVTVPAVTTGPAYTATTRTTTSYATIHTDESKAPFINVGGGVMSDDESVYLALIELVNEERKKAGLNELWYSARLHEVCRTRVVELTSYYSHTRPDGTKFSTAYVEQGISFKVCGENIAYGRNMFKTPEEVFDAWMNSRSHRENILYPDYECAAFGLSIIKVGNDTYYYWTQEFAKF